MTGEEALKTRGCQGEGDDTTLTSDYVKCTIYLAWTISCVYGIYFNTKREAHHD